MEGIGGVIKRAMAQPPNKRMHSDMHVLADEMSSYFGEKKKFGMYLGVIKRIGVAQARAMFAAIKSEPANVQSPRKLFMWMSKGPSGQAPKKPLE